MKGRMVWNDWMDDHDLIFSVNSNERCDYCGRGCSIVMQDDAKQVWEGVDCLHRHGGMKHVLCYPVLGIPNHIIARQAGGRRTGSPLEDFGSSDQMKNDSSISSCTACTQHQILLCASANMENDWVYGKIFPVRLRPSRSLLRCREVRLAAELRVFLCCFSRPHLVLFCRHACEFLQHHSLPLRSDPMASQA